MLQNSWKFLKIGKRCLSLNLPEESRLVGPRSQPVVHVITEKDRNLTWKEAQDHDNLRGKEVFQNDADGEQKSV